MSAQTTFANGINPFTGIKSNSNGEPAMIVYDNSSPLYSFLELLRIHEKWVEGGRIGQQPFASVALPELTQSVGCSMNIAAKDMMMRERVTWSGKTGEIRIKDVEQTAAKAARKNSKAQAAA